MDDRKKVNKQKHFGLFTFPVMEKGAASCFEVDQSQVLILRLEM